MIVMIPFYFLVVKVSTIVDNNNLNTFIESKETEYRSILFRVLHGL